MDGGAWWAAVRGVVKSGTQLSDFTFTFHFHALEKEMATHSSVLAWRIPGTGALWAADYGVAQSRTRLKRPSSSPSSIFSALLYILVNWKANEIFLKSWETVVCYALLYWAETIRPFWKHKLSYYWWYIYEVMMPLIHSSDKIFKSLKD